MNSLSIFLYFADVLGNLQGFLIFFTIFGGFAVGGRAIYCSVEEVPFNYSWLLAPILTGLLGCFIPSTNTMYLIAGSEAGEMVVNSQEGQEILNDVKLAIKNQLKEAQQ